MKQGDMARVKTVPALSLTQAFPPSLDVNVIVPPDYLL